MSDRRYTRKEQAEMDTLNSWIAYSLRETMEEEQVRNAILKKNIKSKNVVFYKTLYGNKDTFADDVRKLIKGMKKKNTYYLFTISNPYDPDTGETHFQSFIYYYDTNDTSDHPEGSRDIYGIDPSDGYYSDWAIRMVNTIIKQEYDNAYMMDVKFTQACQRDDSDVFCQSWSLYLQILGMQELLSGNVNIDFVIPEDTNEKYKILLDFYKNNMGIICRYLKANFNQLVDTNMLKTEELVEPRQVAPTKRILRKYKDSICDIIKNNWDINIFRQI